MHYLVVGLRKLFEQDGVLEKETISSADFFDTIRRCQELVNLVPYTALVSVIGRKSGRLMARAENPLLPTLCKGDVVLVVEADEYKGITTGKGLTFYRVTYRGRTCC